jgi:hypothetical protein
VTGQRPLRVALAEPGVMLRGGLRATWRAGCGIAYFTRHYRPRPVARLPGSPAGLHHTTRRLVSDGVPADTIGSHRGDWTELALVVDALAVEHIMPFCEDQAAIDFARLAMAQPDRAQLLAALHGRQQPPGS